SVTDEPYVPMTATTPSLIMRGSRGQPQREDERQRPSTGHSRAHAGTGPPPKPSVLLHWLRSSSRFAKFQNEGLEGGICTITTQGGLLLPIGMEYCLGKPINGYCYKKEIDRKIAEKERRLTPAAGSLRPTPHARR